MIQIIILLTSCLSIYLLSSRHKLFRWGFVIGLAGQPFWFYESYTKGLWSVCVVSVWFTFAHLRGIKNNFYERGKNTAA